MAEDMSDLMKNFSSMLNGKEIPDDIKNILQNLNSSSNNSDNNTNSENSSCTIPPEMANILANMLNSDKKENFSSSENSSNNQNDFNIDIGTIMKLKSVFDKVNSNKNDPRTNLLLSLKPYLKESRKNKVDQYIQFLKMEKIFEVLGPLGGEQKK